LPITALTAATAIWIGGIAGYADWPWWVGPAIGASASLLNFLPTLIDPLERTSELLSGLVLNVALFGGMPYGTYWLVRWLTH
jgi:hypothetical protein